MVRSLRGRNVIVFPDNDAYEDWTVKNTKLEKQLNTLALLISSYVMNQTIAMDRKVSDIADLFNHAQDNAGGSTTSSEE